MAKWQSVEVSKCQGVKVWYTIVYVYRHVTEALPWYLRAVTSIVVEVPTKVVFKVPLLATPFSVCVTVTPESLLMVCPTSNVNPTVWREEEGRRRKKTEEDGERRKQTEEDGRRRKKRRRECGEIWQVPVHTDLQLIKPTQPPKLFFYLGLQLRSHFAH